MISESYIEQLKEHVKIADVVRAAGIELKKSGTEYVGLCGFHEEKTPSMFVNEEKNCFNCHGCNAGGDALKFIKDYWNLDHFPDLIKKAAEISGFGPVEYEQKEDSAQSREVSTNRAVHKYLTAAYQSALPKDRAAIEYLNSRGINTEDIIKWGIGVSPESEWYFSANACKGKFNLVNLVSAGVQIRKEESGKTFDRFRGRIIFPIQNANGATIAFAGRILPHLASSNEKKVAKYINSPETSIFKKSQVLYGLNHALKSQSPEPGVINVVEGYMDVIAAHKAEFTNTVGTMGVAISSDSIANLFKRYDKIRFVFDGDSAGLEAAVRAITNSMPHVTGEKRVSISVLPTGLDPDEVIKQHKRSGFERVLSNEKSASQFLKNYFIHQLGGISCAEDHAEIITNCKSILEVIQDDDTRQIFLADILNDINGSISEVQLHSLMSEQAIEMINQASPSAITLAGTLLSDKSWLTIGGDKLMANLSATDKRIIDFAIKVNDHCEQTNKTPSDAFINANRYLIEFMLSKAAESAIETMQSISNLSHSTNKAPSHAQSFSVS